MKKRQFLFFDIDGTLVSDHTKEIPESAWKALKLARENGHRIFINSGRAYCCFPPALLEGFNGYLCGCGTNLFLEGKEVLHVTISADKAQEILKNAVKYQVNIVFEGRDKVYFEEKSLRNKQAKMVYDHYVAQGTSVAVVNPGDEMVCSKFCFLIDEKSDFEVFLKTLEKDFDVIVRGGGMYEVLPSGYSKATAIQAVLDFYGGLLEDTWAFGDSNNDLPMLNFAKHAVIMGCHDEGLEKNAEFIADTVERDGLYKIMKQQGII